MKRNGEETTPLLYGLVLSGGKSTRMGRDKGSISYHGKPQREYLYEMLETICDKTFLSIRPEQQEEIPGQWMTITDQNLFRGPLNGILSAHSKYPEVAWLVLACDLPLINQDTLKQLLAGRNPEKAATALATRETRLPEPLAAIWEAHGLEKALEYMLRSESSCPRKFLLNSDTALVFAAEDEQLWNANSEEEYKMALRKL